MENKISPISQQEILKFSLDPKTGIRRGLAKIKNVTHKTLFYKLMYFSQKTSVKCSPSAIGSIQPGSEASINVSFYCAGPLGYELPEFFIKTSTKQFESDPKKFWREVSIKDVQQVKLKCSFEVPVTEGYFACTGPLGDDEPKKFLRPSTQQVNAIQHHRLPDEPLAFVEVAKILKLLLMTALKLAIAASSFLYLFDKVYSH